MKRFAIFLLALVMPLSAVTPANALGSDLAPSGIPSAWKDGFNGRGLEIAVISQQGFFLQNRSIRSAIDSEACFSSYESWWTCPNNSIRQIGRGASLADQPFQVAGDAFIYSMVGSTKAIAPRSKFHAIYAPDISLSFNNAVLHALKEKVTAIVVTDSQYVPERGYEVNCDAAFPQHALAAEQAKAAGVPIFSVPGSNGDSYGLTFPSCLSGVTPVGGLGWDNQLSGQTNVGPGVILGQSSFTTMDQYLDNGREWINNAESVERALPVVTGIYAALLNLGYDSSAAMTALHESGRRIDDIIVKDIPAVTYELAKNWLEANSEAIGPSINSVVQVSKSEVVATLNYVPAKRTQTLVVGYEVYDLDTNKWSSSSFPKSKASAIRFEPGISSGWVRLVVSRAGKTLYTAPMDFSIRSSFSSSSRIDTGIVLPGNELSGLSSTEFPSTQPSTQAWPAISDPAAELLELDYARQMQITGKGVTVAIIDDGIQADHSYFGPGQVVEELCLVMDNSCSNGQNRQIGRSAADPYRFDDGTRESHGTMVAGTIGGQPNSMASGGIAPEVNFIVARVDLNGFDANGGYIDQALEWVASLADQYNIAAVNMSFGYPILERDAARRGQTCANEPRFEAIVSGLRQKGIAPLVAAGNEGLLLAVGGPACESSAIAVGATDNDGTIINYSNISEKVEIVAPAKMRTSLDGDSYNEGSGTSNSTPVVAGAFALARQLRPDLSVDETLYAMQQSADLVDDIIIKDIPRLNIRKFLDYLTPGSDLDGASPSLSVRASGVSCIASFSSNGGKSPVLRFRPAGSDSWWQITEPSSSTTLSGLAARTTYEVEVGAFTDGKVLWSSRETCRTGSGGKPARASGMVVESRGKDWAVVYVPTDKANGYELTDLSYRVGSKVLKATWLGFDRFLLTNITSQRTFRVNVAFSNQRGRGLWAALSLPAYSAVDFTSTSLVTASTGTKLTINQKNGLKADLSSQSGVKTITCTALQESSSSTSFKRSVKARAEDACKYVKTIHKSARVVVKTKNVSEKNLAGVVEVVISGRS